jgi:hypothetical protein
VEARYAVSAVERGEQPEGPMNQFVLYQRGTYELLAISLIDRRIASVMVKGGLKDEFISKFNTHREALEAFNQMEVLVTSRGFVKVG